MVMNARSTSFGSWKFSSRTSTSTTSAPNDRSAFATPRPVASEPSRSDPGPPMSTAIFFGRSVIKSALSSRAESRDPAKLPLGQLHGIFRLPPTSLRSAQNDGKKNSFRFSHDFHFGLQLDPALFPSDALDIVDQLQYLGRRCGAIVHDKVAVYARHARISDSGVLQP